MKQTDSLTMMLLMQKTLQERAYGFKFDDMSVKERVDFIKEMSIHSNQEMNEMLYELPFFKPWKDYSNMTVEEQEAAITAAKKEYIDKLHFDLNILIGLGMSAEEVFEEYSAKNRENYLRQEEGYTHDKSYR